MGASETGSNKNSPNLRPPCREASPAPSLSASTTIAAERECASFFFPLQAAGREEEGVGVVAHELVVGFYWNSPFISKAFRGSPALWRGPRAGTPLSPANLRPSSWYSWTRCVETLWMVSVRCVSQSSGRSPPFSFCICFNLSVSFLHRKMFHCVLCLIFLAFLFHVIADTRHI
jgi:hypothetical protein